jgi:hypothetical protein
MSKDTIKPFVNNCTIKKREGDEPLFVPCGDHILTRLDGYAIVPIEEYEDLIEFVTGKK